MWLHLVINKIVLAFTIREGKWGWGRHQTKGWHLNGNRESLTHTHTHTHRGPCVTKMNYSKVTWYHITWAFYASHTNRTPLLKCSKSPLEIPPPHTMIRGRDLTVYRGRVPGIVSTQRSLIWISWRACKTADHIHTAVKREEGVDREQLWR